MVVCMQRHASEKLFTMSIRSAPLVTACELSFDHENDKKVSELPHDITTEYRGPTQCSD